MQSFWQDLKYAMRSLRNAPSFAIIAVMVFDGKAQSVVPLYQRRGEGGGIVGRIVQYLDL